MKHQKTSIKRAQELKKLYQNQTPARFKIKNKPPNKTHNNIKKTNALSTKELLFSLLLTFVIITIQLLISKLI